MRDLFALFYAVLFGALLSAEIGDQQFRVRWNDRHDLYRWAVRTLCMVLFRAFYFAWIYHLLSPPTSLTRVIDVAGVLGLCAPVLSFQQLSYFWCTGASQGGVPHPPDRASWFLMSVLSGLLALFSARVLGLFGQVPKTSENATHNVPIQVKSVVVVAKIGGANHGEVIPMPKMVKESYKLTIYDGSNSAIAEFDTEKIESWWTGDQSRTLPRRHYQELAQGIAAGLLSCWMATHKRLKAVR